MFGLKEQASQSRSLATNSAAAYIAAQTSNYLIMFVTFILIIAVMVVVLFGIVFVSFKEYMRKVDMTMRIIPVEVL